MKEARLNSSAAAAVIMYIFKNSKGYDTHLVLHSPRISGMFIHNDWSEEKKTFLTNNTTAAAAAAAACCNIF